MKVLISIGVVLGIVACSHQSETTTNEIETQLTQVLNNPVRTEKNKNRDGFRHPAQTLAFFNVQPDMKVLEISPGGGWYTEILGPYLKEKGQLHLAIFADNSEIKYRKKLNKKLREKISKNSKHFGRVKYSTFDWPNKVDNLADSNSLDRVLTFRNIHNWMGEGKEKVAFNEFFRVLKPGGVLGVVEHRAKTDKKQDPKAKSGYVREDYVIQMAEAAGFKLLAKSEINANAKDTADHPKGVWTLPPSLGLKDKNKDKYTAIGESDRMTLKFVKP